MLKSQQLESLAKKLFEVLPPSLRNLEEDIQQKFNAILESAFSRLDLVTREEFDVQVKVLARTREKVETLQAQLNTLLKANADKKQDL